MVHFFVSRNLVVKKGYAVDSYCLLDLAIPILSSLSPVRGRLTISVSCTGGGGASFAADPFLFESGRCCGVLLLNVV